MTINASDVSRVLRAVADKIDERVTNSDGGYELAVHKFTVENEIVDDVPTRDKEGQLWRTRKATGTQHYDFRFTLQNVRIMRRVVD